jgi:hypothetical protein
LKNNNKKILKNSGGGVKGFNRRDMILEFLLRRGVALNVGNNRGIFSEFVGYVSPATRETNF